MTLSERLERAKKERLIAAGVLPSEAALKPARDGPEALDGPSMLQSSISERCPRCGQPGDVDLVDLIGHNKHMTCEACHTMWIVHET